jgi:hypothetical protein
MTRVFVLVEGVHDRLVVEELLGDDLDAGYATCLPIGGAKTLPSLVDASLLFDFTDATIVLVLDNLDSDVLGPIWARLLGAYRAGNNPAVEGALREIGRVPGGEGQWLRSLAEQAVQARTLQRIHLHGLRQPDVICYLPPRFFDLDAESWEPLLRDWRARYAPRAPTDLKGWLREQPRKARIFRRAIERAAQHLRQSGAPVDEDLTALGLRIREAAAWQGPDPQSPVQDE